MTAVNGPKVVSDGLVFGFDMSNTEKSWKGKPTVNLTTDSPTQSGWMGSYTVVDSSTKTFNITTQQNSSATTSAWRTWYWSVAGYAGSTLTISLDVEYVSNVNASFLHFTVGQGNTGQFPTHIAGSNAEDRVQITTKPTEKTHMTWTGVINATEIIGVTQWIGNVTADGDNVTLKISNVQIEVNDFETPFVNGTRGSNSSILDLTLLNNIPTTSLTFDSDGSFSFNGISNYIQTDFDATDHFTENQSWTVSSFVNVVSNVTSGNGRGGIFGTQGYSSEPNPGGFGLNIINGDFCGMLTHDDGAGNNLSYQNVSLIDINYNQMEMITYVYDHSVQTMYAYRNGSLVNSSTSASYKWSPSSQRKAKVGTSTQGGWTYYFPMIIKSVYVYNRALTADEVLNNYEASKNKYI